MTPPRITFTPHLPSPTRSGLQGRCLWSSSLVVVPRAIPWRHIQGASRRGCAPVPNPMWGRGLSVVVVAASHAAFPLRLWQLSPRHSMAPPPGACGRGCAPAPNSMWGRGLSERSEFRSPHLRDRGKGTRRATPGRPWFWVLLPKQKDLGVRGRTPARMNLFSPLPSAGEDRVRYRPGT